MADVLAFFEKMFTPNSISKKMFFFKQIDFLKNLKKCTYECSNKLVKIYIKNI